MAMNTCPQNDAELGPWVSGIHESKPCKAGSFLREIAAAAFLADEDNYTLLRPVLVALMAKYPNYHNPKFTVEGQ